MSMSETLFSFKGRIGRPTFWLYGIVGLSIADFIVELLLGGLMHSQISVISAFGSILNLVFALVLLWAELAISVKRWHDRGKSGWWILIGLIPIIGWLWVIVETCFLPGTDGPNEYGQQP